MRTQTRNAGRYPSDLIDVFNFRGDSLVLVRW